MELGLTFLLQQFLNMKAPVYGRSSDRRFCRDLHVIDLRGATSVCLWPVTIAKASLLEYNEHHLTDQPAITAAMRDK